jgi:plasmid maintenance system antidote protein VapI
LAKWVGFWAFAIFGKLKGEKMILEYAQRALSMHYPSIHEQAVECKMVCAFEMAVRLSDDSVVVFNTSDKTIRNMAAKYDAMTEDEYRTELGHRIHSRMMIKCLSQKDLAERTGITQQLLSRYINGKTLPSFYTVARIARGLGCSVTELDCTY